MGEFAAFLLLKNGPQQPKSVPKPTPVVEKTSPPVEVTPVAPIVEEKAKEEFPVLQVAKQQTKVIEKEEPKKKKQAIRSLEEEMKFLVIVASVMTLILQEKSSKVQGMEGSLFSFLVDEIIVEIFTYSKPTELGRLSVVCKDWLRITGGIKEYLK